MVQSVLFVCLGNICRSPTAQGVFRSIIKQMGLELCHDSAGTSGWHIGDAPYGLMQQAALRSGYDIGDLRARQVCIDDFYKFDFIVAMDRQNLADLNDQMPVDATAQCVLMGDYASGACFQNDVPDPYYTRDFDATVMMLENAMQRFVQCIITSS